MTLEKVQGRYVGDFRYKGFPRLRIAMGTPKKAEAEARHEAVAKLFRQNRRDLIDQLRLPAGHPQRLTPERLAAMVEHHEPLAPIPAPVLPEIDASTWGTVDEVTERYLDWLANHPTKAKQTHTTARAQLRRFAAYEYEGHRVGDLALEAVTPDLVEAYQRSLIAAGTPANTVTGYMVRVGALWNWQAKQEGRAARTARRAPRPVFSPVDGEMLVRKTTARERYLTPEEAARVLAAAPDQLLAPIGLALLAGLRRGEAVHLAPRDVDLEVGVLTVREKRLPDGSEWRTKTKRSQRSVPIAAELRPLLERHLARYASEAWLTPRSLAPAWPIGERHLTMEFGKVVTSAKLTAGRTDPNGVTYHTLRHTFASWLVMRGVDLYTVAQLLGDTLATVERTYAHLSPDFKRAAIAKLAGAVTMPETDMGLATETRENVK